MDTVNNFYKEIEKRFPHCIFNKRGNKIILNDGSFHGGMLAFDMTKIDGNYRFGVHKDIVEYANECGFETLCTDKNEVQIFLK